MRYRTALTAGVDRSVSYSLVFIFPTAICNKLSTGDVIKSTFCKRLFIFIYRRPDSTVCQSRNFWFKCFCVRFVNQMSCMFSFLVSERPRQTLLLNYSATLNYGWIWFLWLRQARQDHWFLDLSVPRDFYTSLRLGHCRTFYWHFSCIYRPLFTKLSAKLLTSTREWMDLLHFGAIRMAPWSG